MEEVFVEVFAVCVNDLERTFKVTKTAYEEFYKRI